MDINMDMTREYIRQPDEAWFSTLADLRKSAWDSAQASRTLKGNLGNLSFTNVSGEIALDTSSGKKLFPNKHAFGQLTTELGGAARYLRSKPTDLAVENLNHDLELYRADAAKDDRLQKLLVTEIEGRSSLRAVTGPDYGRIWNYQAADLSAEVNEAANGTFYNPPVWPGTGRGHDHGGLWLNDRQIILFFIDGGSMVDGGGERDQMYRGYVMRNSEVGDAKFFWELFYFRVVCGNLMIMGKQQVAEVSIIHRKHANEHFKTMAPEMTNLLSVDTRAQTERIIRAAKGIELPRTPFHKGERQDDSKLLEFKPLQAFPKALAKRGIATAIAEEGNCNNLWELVQGLTAEARMLPVAQDRFAASAKASKMLEIAEAELV